MHPTTTAPASAPAKIVIKHRHTGAVLFEYQPTAEQQASDLRGANLRGANLRGANLRGANLRGANLRDANLGGAYLGDANLIGANLDGANLRGANLDGANLIGAYLGDANLRGANLRGANLDGANLIGAYLGDANLRGANLRGANLIGDRPIFMIGPIGSRSDYFVSYLTDVGLILNAGCFTGTVDEFETKLAKEHGDNNVHAQEYRAALELVRCHARLWTTSTTETADA